MKTPNHEQTAEMQAGLQEESLCIRRSVETVLRLARDCASEGCAEANQQAIEISGPGSVVVLMGLAGPHDSITVPLLSNLYLDKTIRFSLLYPLQWPTAIKILAGRTVDTSKIITHSATLEGIAPAIERVLIRDDAVIKTVITP